jgi:hypothetical protein
VAGFFAEMDRGVSFPAFDRIDHDAVVGIVLSGSVAGFALDPILESECGNKVRERSSCLSCDKTDISDSSGDSQSSTFW